MNQKDLRAGTEKTRKLVDSPDDELGQEKPYVVYVTDEIGEVEGTMDVTYEYSRYSVYIYEEIVEPKAYTDLFHIIRSAKSTDKLDFYINSHGGDLDTICAFSACFQECLAEITTIVDGNADSAAFVLVCMGDVIRISEVSQMLAHNVRISTNLNTINNVNSFINTSKYNYSKLLKKYCSKILTDDEIDNIIKNDAEIQLTSDDVIDRLRNNVNMEMLDDTVAAVLPKGDDEITETKKEKEKNK